MIQFESYQEGDRRRDREYWIETILPFSFWHLREYLTKFMIDDLHNEYHHGGGTPICEYRSTTGEHIGWAFYYHKI